MSNIILVGNGPSLLNKGLGLKIDQFDKVVRFNNFETGGYELHVGHKTDYIARRSCDDVKMWGSAMFEKIFVFVTYCKWTAGMVAVSRHLQSHYGKKCEVVSQLTCAKYGRLMGLDQPLREWASCGVLALSHFTEMYDHVTICGFDHLEKGEDGNVHHYFNKPPKDDRFHNGEKERAYVESLIAKGKVSRLV